MAQRRQCVVETGSGRRTDFDATVDAKRESLGRERFAVVNDHVGAVAVVTDVDLPANGPVQVTGEDSHLGREVRRSRHQEWRGQC